VNTVFTIRAVTTALSPDTVSAYADGVMPII